MGFVVADLTDASVAHRGGNVWESNGLVHRAKQMSAAHRAEEDLARAATDRRIDERGLARQAQFDALPSPGSLASQVRDMRGNRALEQEQARPDAARRFSPASEIDRAVVPAGAGTGSSGNVVQLGGRERRSGAFSMRDLKRAHEEDPPHAPPTKEDATSTAEDGGDDGR